MYLNSQENYLDEKEMSFNGENSIIMHLKKTTQQKNIN